MNMNIIYKLYTCSPVWNVRWVSIIILFTRCVATFSLTEVVEVLRHCIGLMIRCIILRAVAVSIQMNIFQSNPFPTSPFEVALNYNTLQDAWDWSVWFLLLIGSDFRHMVDNVLTVMTQTNIWNMVHIKEMAVDRSTEQDYLRDCNR